MMKSEVIKIKDIINHEETDEAFIKKYGNLILVKESDIEESISRTKIYTALYDAGADVNSIHFTNLSGVAIERGQEISFTDNQSKKIKRKISSGFSIPFQDINIVKTRILPKIQQDNIANIRVKRIYPTDLTNLNNAKFRIKIQGTDGILRDYLLYAKIDIETKVLIASETLRPGTKIEKGNYFSSKQKIKSLTDKIVHSEDLNEKTFKTIKTIARDDILVKSSIQHAVIVPEGSIITLRYKTPFMTIKTLGTLRGTKEIGQLVRVENLDSRRVVTGRLISQDIVEVANAF